MRKVQDADVEYGTREAWLLWMDQHPVTLDEIISANIHKAFTAWLDAHHDDIIVAIVTAWRSATD